MEEAPPVAPLEVVATVEASPDAVPPSDVNARGRQEWVEFCPSCGCDDVRWWPSAPRRGLQAMRRCFRCRQTKLMGAF